jgi:hypothetical protein
MINQVTIHRRTRLTDDRLLTVYKFKRKYFVTLANHGLQPSDTLIDEVCLSDAMKVYNEVLVEDFQSLFVD